MMTKPHLVVFGIATSGYAIGGDCIKATAGTRTACNTAPGFDQPPDGCPDMAPVNGACPACLGNAAIGFSSCTSLNVMCVWQKRVSDNHRCINEGGLQFYTALCKTVGGLSCGGGEG